MEILHIQGAMRMMERELIKRIEENIFNACMLTIALMLLIPLRD